MGAWRGLGGVAGIAAGLCGLLAAQPPAVKGPAPKGGAIQPGLDLSGVWLHQPPGTKAGEITLLPNGKLNSTDAKDTWKFDGTQLTLRWVNPKAPGGAWVDVCRVSPDGKSYEGENQNGGKIVGKKVRDLPRAGLVVQIGHTAAVTAVAFSPNGTQALTGSGDGTARLWDVATGNTVRVFPGHGGGVVAAGFTPDGTQVVTGAGDAVRFWEVATGRLVRTFPAGRVHTLMLVPDGRHLLTGGDGGTDLRDAATGAVVRAFGRGAEAKEAAISADGKLVATGGVGRNAAVHIWDAATGTEVLALPRAGQVNAVAFTPNGRSVLTSGAFDGVVRLWDVATGDVTRTFGGQLENEGGALAVSPDGRRLLTGARGGFVLWDLATGQKLGTIQADSGSLTHAVVFTPDGKAVLSGGSSPVARLWDVSDLGGQPPAIRGHRDVVGCMALTPDGKAVLTGSWDKTARLWDAATGRLLLTLDRHTDWVNAVAVSADGTQALTGGREGTARLWDLRAGRELRAFGPHDSGVTAVAISADGRRVVTADHRTARVWDSDSGRELRQLRAEGGISCVAVSADGTRVLTGCSNSTAGPPIKTAQVWDAITGGPLHTLVTRSPVAGVAFSADGKQALTADADGVRVWDPATGEKVHAVKVSGNHIAFSADGRRFVTGDGTFARVWDATGREVGTFTGGFAVAISADGTRVASADGWKGPAPVFTPTGDLVPPAAGARGNAVRVWDAAARKQVTRTFGGGTPAPRWVRFSPDGKHVLTGLDDGTTRVWDATTGKDPEPPLTETGPLGCLVHSPGGAWILTAGPDDRTRIRDPQTGAVLRDLGVPCGAAAVSPDGRCLLTAAANRVRLWDTANWAELRAVTADADHVAFSRDGKLFFTKWDDQPIRTWDAESGQELRNVETVRPSAVDKAKLFRPAVLDNGQAALSTDGKRYYVLRPLGVAVECLDATSATSYGQLGASSHGVTAGHGFTCLALSPDGRFLMTGSGDGVARLWKADRFQYADAKVREFQGHAGAVTSVAFSPDGRRVLTGSGDRTVRLWDAGSGQELCRLYHLAGGGRLVTTPDNYYTVSKAARSAIGFSIGTRAYEFDQFDLRFNRPDQVLTRVGRAPPELLTAYRRAYDKRLKQAGFTEDMLKDDFHAPELTATLAAGVATGDKTIKVAVRATDSRYTLRNLRVAVNGVPAPGPAGLDFRSRPAQTWEGDVEIELSAGPNRIDVSVLNEKGVESLRQSIAVRCDAPAPKPDLYVVAVGVSDYSDARFKLNYADKDARDLAAFFEGRRGRYGQVRVLTVLNRDATRENIVKSAEFLKPARVDDTVVLFFAGHGLLDAELNYYFATADVDFAGPAKRGLPYEAVVGLLDGVRARRRLVLVDTCHSGELDKEDIRVGDDGKVAGGRVIARAFRGGLTPEFAPRVGLANSYRLLQELFADLRRGTGAVVIASAGGAEYAIESDTWKNGVFTHAVLRGLRGEAVRNKGGRVQMSELWDFVEREVRRLTNGRQSPTVRSDNLVVEFAIE